MTSLRHTKCSTFSWLRKDFPKKGRQTDSSCCISVKNANDRFVLRRSTLFPELNGPESANMKKLLIFSAVIAASYYLYNQSGANAGVYADDGTPKTILFTTQQCGEACDEIRRFLKKRTEFEELDAFDNGNGRDLYKDYGGTGYLPYIAMGKQRIEGHDRGKIVSSIAIEFGLDEVKKSERRALERNFDAAGNPRIVMYATERCGYCRAAAEYFTKNGIDYISLDIEKDRSARRDFDVLMGSGTPLLYNGYARLSGFHESLVENALNL